MKSPRTAGPRLLRKWCACLFLLLLLVRPGFAMMISIDGYASLDIVLVSDSTVVCSTRVSSTPHQNLLGLDALTGALKWKVQTTNVLTQGVLADPNSFLVVTRDFLEKRSLVTGKIIWSTPLAAIPEQKTTPRRLLKDYVEMAKEKVGLSSGGISLRITAGLGRTPNSYWYCDPILTGSRILLTREAYSGTGGCIIMTCFHDWLLFDAKSGKIVEGGSGKMLGRTLTSTLVGDDIGMFHVESGNIQRRDDLALAGRSDWDSTGSGSHYNYEKLSLNDRCVFGVSSSAGNELVIFDNRTGKMRTMLIPTTRPDHQSGWVLLDKHILRYSECPRYGSDKATAAAAGPWFELYDWDGKCIRTSVMAANKKPASWSWIHFRDRATNAITFDMDGKLFTVAIPSLAVSELANDKTREGQNRFFPEPIVSSPFGKIQYQGLGSTNMYVMSSDVVGHNLTVVARDSKTGKALWKHTERVTVKREK
jgi:hypothetical protein